MSSLLLLRRLYASTAFKIGRLNHIAIATRDLPGQLWLFRDVLGAEIGAERVVR